MRTTRITVEFSASSLLVVCADLTIVPELSSVAMQGQPVRVIAFPSFNAAQFATVCAEINATAFTVLNGVPPRRENEVATSSDS